MSWLVLDANGAIAAILSDDPSGHETRAVIERAVPVGYPETISWDAATLQFSLDGGKALAAIRVERNVRLAVCDWTQLPDVPAPTAEVWRTYRQALRDFPETCDPTNPQWPEPPEGLT